MKCAAAILTGVLFSSSAAWSAITVDGTRDAEYGPALAVQTVETMFGDNLSEWDAAYAKIQSGRLFVMLTGNLENNFNKLEIFIDSKAGGQSIFNSAGNDGTAAMNGLVFDTGFAADYHLIMRRGFDGTDNKFDVDFADLGTLSASSYFNIFGGAQAGAGNTGTGVNLQTIAVAYDDSNTAGILGGSAAADQLAALAVTTGLEFSIDLTDLGASGDIRVMVGQNNQGHNYWSNQFLDGLSAPQGNLGSDEFGGFNGLGAIDMTHFAGDQFFTVVPEPSTITLLAVASLVALGRAYRRDAKSVR
jgi:hypothetical protein